MFTNAANRKNQNQGGPFENGWENTHRHQATPPMHAKQFIYIYKAGKAEKDGPNLECP